MALTSTPRLKTAFGQWAMHSNAHVPLPCLQSANVTVAFAAMPDATMVPHVCLAAASR